jgi:hypothetical protein
VRLQSLDELVADPVVHLGEHVAVEQVGERGSERAPLVAIDELEQVGDVGRVERLDQRARAFRVARFDAVQHAAHELGLQPVVLVKRSPVWECATGAFEFAVAHRPLRALVPSRAS